MNDQPPDRTSLRSILWVLIDHAPDAFCRERNTIFCHRCRFAARLALESRPNGATHSQRRFDSRPPISQAPENRHHMHSNRREHVRFTANDAASARPRAPTCSRRPSDYSIRTSLHARVDEASAYRDVRQLEEDLAARSLISPTVPIRVPSQILTRLADCLRMASSLENLQRGCPTPVAPAHADSRIAVRRLDATTQPVRTRFRTRSSKVPTSNVNAPTGLAPR